MPTSPSTGIDPGSTANGVPLNPFRKPLNHLGFTLELSEDMGVPHSPTFRAS